MIQVISTTFSSIGYQEGIQTLRVQFHNGILYEYLNFPLIEFEQFLDSPSKGEYFNSNVKNKYPFSKIG